MVEVAMVNPFYRHFTYLCAFLVENDEKFEQCHADCRPNDGASRICVDLSARSFGHKGEAYYNKTAK